MKLGSACRADRAQSNGPILRSLANFHIELEQFCFSLTYPPPHLVVNRAFSFVDKSANSGRIFARVL